VTGPVVRYAAGAGESQSTGPLSVEVFRDSLAHRHNQEQAIGEDGIANALLTFSLMRAQTRLSQDFESMHRKRGWTWSGFRIMNVLWAVGPLDQRDLARLSGGSRAAISSAVNTLERAGLVTRFRGTDDRRLVNVALTDTGTEELRAVMTDQVRREAAWFNLLSQEERASLVALLTRIADQPRPDSLDVSEGFDPTGDKLPEAGPATARPPA
jgi:DNA-binding MarR family transcriptional regulator